MGKTTFYARSVVCAITLLFSFNSYSQTAVNVVNSFSGYAGVTSSSIFTLSNVEVLSGTDRLMMVGVSTKDGIVISVKYNNVPLNLVGYLDGTNMSTQAPIQNGSNAAEVYIYSYLNPPIGTADVVVTLDSDYKKGIVVGATNFSGVDQTNPLGTVASASYNDDSESPFDLNVPSSIGSLIFDVSSVRNGTQTMAVGQTQLYNINSGSETHGGSSTKVATTTSTLISWSSTSCEEVGRAAVSINPFNPSQVSITCDFIATQDSYIKKNKDTENFGSCTDLLVDREGGDLHRALIQFDLSSIPSNATIISSELRLNCTDEKNMTVSVFQIGTTDEWDEGSSCTSAGVSNWNLRQGSSNWTAAGVVGVNSSDGTPLGTISGNTLGIQSWPLTTLTQGWLAGTITNNGVMVGSQDGGGDRVVTYDSRETTTGIPPALRVTYSIELDSDFDGVSDYVDIDDDNDGILDTIECATIENPPLSDPDFEAIDIVTSGLDGGPTDATPSSGLWKGDASNIPFWESADPINNYLEIWSNTQTASNDVGGQAYSGNQWAEINASTNDGLYQDIVSTPGDLLQWSFAHRKRTGYAGSATEDIARLMIGDPGGTMSSQGDFTSAGDASWTLHSGTYVVPPGQTTTRLTFTWVNSVSGSSSSGNFVDNVQLFVIPVDCADTDGDSIPDYFDLDSDNDGIPDIVEAGFGSASSGTATIPLGSFTDANGNGMHDAFENTSPLDSDNDGVPNFKDLDSDNDTVFDVDEARTERTVSGVLVHENGDGDINGDGVGDGTESEAFRVRAIPGGCTELFGDGILDIYDYGTGANQYGNLSQGSAPFYVNNEDNGVVPDYIDLDSNDDGKFDIAETHYAHLDGNNDGIIDDTNDNDSDGLMDSFDTNDNGFGSPRDLDKKLLLSFDGRNDYMEDINVINGWSEATLMGWIKIDPSAAGTQIIMGQNAFYLQLNTDKSITAYGNGYTTTDGVAQNTNQWVHIAATYSNFNNNIKLYINGKNVSNTTVSGSLPADTSSLTLGRQPNTNSKYFNGFLDEVRIFFKALSNNEIEKLVYQEIENNSGITKGLAINKDVTRYIDEQEGTPGSSIPLDWSQLKRYFRMDTYKDNVIDDLTTASIDEGSGAKIYNTKIIDVQSAPMPFVTKRSGTLAEAVDDPENGINGNDVVDYDYSIVKVKHNDITFDKDHKHVALIIDAEDEDSNPITMKVSNNSELNVSWYLKLDGKIDLEDESQLVQGPESELDPASSGTLERDQQGTADSFTYNYWSSPVGMSNMSTNNNNYTLPNVFKNGTIPSTPNAITFLTSGYNGNISGSNISIADYWIWKYANLTADNYSSWQHVRSTGTLLPGQGFTMKGVKDTGGAITQQQNYVFQGKPNNSDVALTIASGNEYLVGNPYPSAIDANEFILDNISDGSGRAASNIINGALYFWDHFAISSHALGEYQGGYATYTLMGGTPAVSNDIRINATGVIGTKIPERYIPVGQGFFVSADMDIALTGIATVTGGNVTFKNNQRIFKVEGVTGTNSGSIFTKSSTKGKATAQEEENIDTRQKIRLVYDSPAGYHRQLLVGVDENASNEFDLGYEALLNELNKEDMYWEFNNTKFIIQAVNNFDDQQILPLGIKTHKEGIASIRIETLENIGANKTIFIHDKELNQYHNLKESNYEVFLTVGEHSDRFEITFSSAQTLDTQNFEGTSLQVYFSNNKENIIVHNPNLKQIKSIEIFNILGQSIYQFYVESKENYMEYQTKNITDGVYLINMKTDIETLAKKVLIK